MLTAAGAVSDTPGNFDPFSTNAATDADGNAFLPGTDGNPVPVDCRFVPFGQYSCDPVDITSFGFDPGFVSYANFFDSKVPTSQAPYKPYFALPIREFHGIRHPRQCNLRHHRRSAAGLYRLLSRSMNPSGARTRMRRRFRSPSSTTS